MKKLSLTILSIILISTIVCSQTEWEYLDFDGSVISDIEIDGNGNIYAAVGQIYKSSDNGITWELKNNGLPPGGGSRLDHYNNQIYFATYQGLYNSTNGGDSWFRIAQSVPYTYFDEVRVVTNGYIFVSVFDMGGGGIYKSTDEGVTWVATSFTEIGARDIGMNTNGVMFFSIATLGGFGTYRSFDLGMNWEISTSSIGAQAIAFLNDGNVLIGGEPGPSGAGIYKSTDNGNVWFNTNAFIGGNAFTDFVLDTNNDIYVSILGDNQGVYISDDSGSNWNYQGLGNINVYCLAIDSIGYVYAGTFHDGIFRMPGKTTPVELVSFSAVVKECDVELSWITATELNNSGFEIHRAMQKDNWNKVGFVEGHRTTTETQQYSFTDSDVKSGKYQYKLKQIDYDGSFEYSKTIEVAVPLVKDFSLSRNYPNPFNPVTMIIFEIPERSFVTVKVYDVLGNEIATLVNEDKPSGRYEVEFDGKGLTSGIYFYQLQAGNYVETKKMILLK